MRIPRPFQYLCSTGLAGVIRVLKRTLCRLRRYLSVDFTTMRGTLQLNYHGGRRRSRKRWIALAIAISLLATGAHFRRPIRRASAIFLCRYFPWDGPWVRLAPALDGQDEESVLSEDEECFAREFGIRYLPLLEKAHHDRGVVLRYLQLSTSSGLAISAAGSECYIDDCRDLLDSWPEQDVSAFLVQLDASTRRRIAYILQSRHEEVDMPEDGSKWRAFTTARPTLAKKVIEILKEPDPSVH
jgi:hypothetical protein